MGLENRQVEAAFNPHTLIIDENSTVTECAKMMNDMCVGLLVIAEDNKPKGVISERDIVFKIVAEGLNPDDTKIKKIMTQSVLTVTTDCSLLKAWDIMNLHKIRHLVVVDEEEKIAGILSVRDIVGRIALEQEVSGLLESLEIDITDLNPAEV